MDTTFDQLVTTDVQSGLIVTRGIPFSSYKSENIPNTSNEESILDLSQRSTTTRKELINSNTRSIVIDNWNKDLICNYTDDIDEDLNRILIINNDDNQLNIEQSLTDQLRNNLKKENSLSDNYYQSQIDLYSSRKKSK
jgi:hypothetical protein